MAGHPWGARGKTWVFGEEIWLIDAHLTNPLWGESASRKFEGEGCSEDGPEQDLLVSVQNGS